MRKDVFISYARADMPRVRSLVAALLLSEVQAWWDQQLEPGESWRRILLQRLSTVDGLVVCWTPSSIASTYVQAEANIGLDRALLIPVSLLACKPPLPFSEIQTIDLTSWQGDREDPQFHRLLKAIARVHHERKSMERFEAARRKLAQLFETIDLGRVRRDAEAGRPTAQSLLGHAFVVGVAALQRNVSEGLSWLRLAAEQGDVDAAATLGTAHALLVDPADWREAVLWFECAARLGHRDAALELAHIYATGFEGVPKNDELADWYTRLAVTAKVAP